MALTKVNFFDAGIRVRRRDADAADRIGLRRALRDVRLRDRADVRGFGA